MRGISLRRTLQQAGSLWRYRPSELSFVQRTRLYHASRPTKHFDIFLSHTWLTSGKWKYLSLLIHFGWRTMLVSWVVGSLLSFVLCLQGILPLFSTYQARAVDFNGEIPYGCWVMLGGFIAAIGGLLASPYFPGGRSDICFLDFVSIHQTDEVRMQEGIDNIGHFLAASAELRVLWSGPYLKRLWCVFELAAYRKQNPTGKITLQPIFGEIGLCQAFLSAQVVVFLFWCARKGPEGGDPLRMVVVLTCGLAVMFPPVAHAMWKWQEWLEKLDCDLSTFDVLNAECSVERDRERIHAAIVQWYGSLTAFSEQVRGPFRLEVLDLIRAGGSIPAGYVAVVAAPLLGVSVEATLGLWKAGAPWQTRLAVLLSHNVALHLLWIPSITIISAFARKRGLWARSCGCKALEYACILLVFYIFLTLGCIMAGMISAWGFEWVLMWLCMAVVTTAFAWCCCWRS